MKLRTAANDPLYSSCTSFSKLSFILHLFHLKCMHKWSGESFTKLLELLVDAFPQILEFPQSYYEGKRLIKDLGLGYEKTNVCPNNCVLYWGDLAGEDKCHVCGTSRWKLKGSEDKSTSSEVAKTARYFPLMPRLKRGFLCKKIAELMRWHYEARVQDGKLRHPADGQSWASFDELYQLDTHDRVGLGWFIIGFQRRVRNFLKMERRQGQCRHMLTLLDPKAMQAENKNLLMKREESQGVLSGLSLRTS